jgi:DNA-binding transcriptional regulator YdaS (Cro superfamily)
MKHRTKMPTAAKRNNMLLIKIDKVVLAEKLGVTPSNIRQLLSGKRSNARRLSGIKAITGSELRSLEIGSARHGSIADLNGNWRRRRLAMSREEHRREQEAREFQA